jgi:TPR repeat protein
MCLFHDIRDHTRALRLAHRSAGAGSAYGQYAVGFAHQYGLGGAEEDYASALQAYLRAAGQGLADAQ